ncbi:MAG TPA: SPASM domain-containing protein, partial [Methanobacterium sp.]|nr:SPASM domain-containing protein [Methanobacterium sp.]
LLIYLLDEYLDHMDNISVKNIDHICKSIFTRRGAVCTFVDCMDDTYAVGPDGSIYPCYRFVGMPEWIMGNVTDHPSREELENSKPWKFLHEYKEYVDENCKRCTYIKFCRGGCPYNALAKTNGKIEDVDPHCIAYKTIFKEITRRLTKEMLGNATLGLGTEESGKKTRPGIMALMIKPS